MGIFRKKTSPAMERSEEQLQIAKNGERQAKASARAKRISDSGYPHGVGVWDRPARPAAEYCRPDRGTGGAKSGKKAGNSAKTAGRSPGKPGTAKAPAGTEHRIFHRGGTGHRGRR